MRVSHKWSHTETIHQAQSQSHNLTSSHKISGSYPPGSAYPSHIFILFHVTTTGTILQAQFQISHQWRLSTRLSLTITHFPHHLGLFLTQRSQINHHSNINSHFTISHFNTNSHVNVLISFLSTYTTHFHIHIILKSQIINLHHSYTQFTSYHNSCQFMHSITFIYMLYFIFLSHNCQFTLSDIVLIYVYNLYFNDQPSFQTTSYILLSISHFINLLIAYHIFYSFHLYHYISYVQKNQHTYHYINNYLLKASTPSKYTICIRARHTRWPTSKHAR